MNSLLPFFSTAKNADTESHRVSSLERAARAHRKALHQRVLLTFLAVALFSCSLINYALYQHWVVDRSKANLSALSTAYLTQKKQHLEQQLQQQHNALRDIVNSPALLVALGVEEGIHDGLTDEARYEQWRETMPSMLDIHLIANGSATLDRDAPLPIRYAELDLIQRAESLKNPAPEIAVFDGKTVVQWALPIVPPKEDKPWGTLFARLNAQDLLSNLTNDLDTKGKLSLIQHFSGSPEQTLITRGDASSKPQRLPIAHSHLSVSFAPSPQFIEASAESHAFWLFFASLITVGALVLASVGSRIVVRVMLHRQRDQGPALPELMEQHKKDQPATPVELVTLRNYTPPSTTTTSEPKTQQDVLSTLVPGLLESPEPIDPARVPVDIFRSYDIRGLVHSQITPELARWIGLAAGSEALERGEHSLIVARDGRTHSDALTRALIDGILATGCHVINIGLVPTPLMYFATFHFDDCSSGVMVTASHNRKTYNGFKIVMENRALADEAVLNLRARILENTFHTGEGRETQRPIIPDYIQRIFSDVALANDITLVVDGGNAVPGLVAPLLFETLGCNVIPLYCELDGEFPHHDPDPTHAPNLTALIEKVKETGADMGVAFDGDGDRLVVVTPKGNILWPDRLLMLYARDILSRHPGADVLFDVKCSRQLNQLITSYGGRPIMWKTGHSPMKAKMEETQALIGGEYSGHIFIKDRWYGFDDGIYAMARLLEIVTLRDQPLDDIFDSFPTLCATPEFKVAVADDEKFALLSKIMADGDFGSGTITTIDGLRIDYPKGWGLVRASNTSPALTLRFEAETPEALEKIQHVFKRELLKANPHLVIPFH